MVRGAATPDKSEPSVKKPQSAYRSAAFSFCELSSEFEASACRGKVGTAFAGKSVHWTDLWFRYDPITTCAKTKR